MNVNIKSINGKEILDFLNNLDFNTEELDDVSCKKPFIFENQKLGNERYRLTFSAHYNNWGTYQLIEDNFIEILEDRVIVVLEEPFEGDGSDEVLENLLTKWLETHKFNTNYVNHFDALVLLTTQILSNCKYGDIKAIDTAINTLTNAKTLIK